MFLVNAGPRSEERREAGSEVEGRGREGLCDAIEEETEEGDDGGAGQGEGGEDSQTGTKLHTWTSFSTFFGYSALFTQSRLCTVLAYFLNSCLR